ncbi:MAG: hypothetical protein ABI977_05555 [Acidobacteriota bacterium]
MAQVLAFNKQSQQQIKDVHEAVKSAKTKMHTIALIVMCVAALFIVLAAGYTWWHNYELFSRGTSSKIVAAFPATLLDGSLVLLIPAAIWWFVSPLQRTIAGISHVLLFVIVGFHTVLNNSLHTGEPLNGGMKAYLQVGIYASFLLVLGIWILLIHFDSRVKQHEDEARLNERASAKAHELGVKVKEFELEQTEADLEFEMAKARALHNARMKAYGSEEVVGAFIEFEQQAAMIEARDIKGLLPKV